MTYRRLSVLNGEHQQINSNLYYRPIKCFAMKIFAVHLFNGAKFLVTHRIVHSLRNASFLAAESVQKNDTATHIRSVLAMRTDCYLFDVNKHPAPCIANDCWEPELDRLVRAANQARSPMRFYFNPSVRSSMSSSTSSSSMPRKSSYTPQSSTKLSAIDRFCLDSLEKWPKSKILYVLDIWHTRKYTTVYAEHLQNDFLNEIYEISAVGHVLQMLYYISYKRTRLDREHIQNIQDKFLNLFDQLTIDEQSIFCATLIRSDSKFHNSTLVDALITSLMNADLMRCNGMSITSILKAIRWYATPTNITRTKQLQEKLIAVASVAEIECLTHIALLGYNLHVFNYKLVETIIRRFLENLDSMRIKDVERACLVLSALSASQFRTDDHIVGEFCQQIQPYLRRSLHTKYPHTIIHCISHLSICGTIQMELIEWALDEGLKACRKQRVHPIPRELLAINSFAQINLAGQYKGPVLNDDYAAELRRKVRSDLEGHNKQMIEFILDVFNRNKLHMLPHRIVPHSSIPDLVFVYDKRTNRTATFSIDSTTSNCILQASDLHKNNKDLVAVAIVTSSWQQQLHGKNANHGFFQHRLNQLNLLGFRTIVMTHKDWKYCDSFDAKRRYLLRELCRHDVFLLNCIQMQAK